MYVYVKQWKGSGISPQRYCKENNLTTASFNYWLKDYIKRNGPIVNKQAKDSFIPVKVSDTKPEDPENTNRIEIKYPNGVCISLSTDTSIDKLKPLINI